MLINVDINMHWTMTTISIVISTLKITVYTKKKTNKKQNTRKSAILYSRIRLVLVLVLSTGILL